MSEKKIPYKIYLEENEMPKEWYNVRADMKKKPDRHEVMKEMINDDSIFERIR